MSSIFDWSVTPANNATADAQINWAEGQAPSTVNNSARVMMERVKEFISDLGSTNTVGGTANAITITATSPFSAYSDGLRLSFRAGSVNTGAATINANSVGAKAIRKFTAAGEVDVLAADLQTGRIYEVVYFAALNTAAGAWLLMNPSFGWEPIGDFTVSAAASLSVINLSAFRKLRITGKLVTSASANIFLRTSTNNGSSYDSGASDYAYQVSYTTGTGGASGGTTTTTSIILTPASSDAGGAVNFEQVYEGFNKAELGSTRGSCLGIAAGVFFIGLAGGQRNAAVARNAIQIFVSSGTMTGNVTVEGIRG